MRLNKKQVIIGFILSAFLVVSTSEAAQRTKPVVAIKKAKVGEGVSRYAKKYLNLTTIWDEMEAAIQKNRKFELVSRKSEVMKEILEEQNFANSDLSTGNAATAGQMKGANFLILPTVQDFKFYRSFKSIPNLDHTYVKRDIGLLEINAQIIDTSTGSIKTTFYLKANFATAKKIVNRKGGVPSSVNFTRMAKKVAAQMTSQLVNVVFPMQIINIQRNKVYINRGNDGGLKKGQILTVFKPGVTLIDPITGENLGSAEEDIGKVKVTRINPKFTVAKMLGHVADDIEIGDIVRK